MKIKLLSLLIFATFTFNCIAQKQNRIPSEKPKLIIGIVVDGMRYDYVYRYWDNFQENGFKKLINEGTFCKNANYNYLFTQSNVGYATISTGAMPSSHGIISDKLYNRSKGKMVYCTKDNSVKCVGSDNKNANMSPKELLTSTIADELKLSNNDNSKIITVSINAGASILAGGHTTDVSYWFDKETGNWITSSFYIDSLPNWVVDFNNKKIPDIYLNRQWNPALPVERYSDGNTQGKSKRIGFYKKSGFPYDLLNLKKKSKNYTVLENTPFGNTYTKDFAIAAILNENLGKDNYPDYLSVGFTSTGIIGQSCGINSIELEDAYVRLDKEIAHFLSFVNNNIGKNNVLIFLTSNHGSAYAPQTLIDKKIPAGYFNSDRAMLLLRTYMNAVYGRGDWIKVYYDKSIYLNRNLIEDSQLSLKDVQTKVAQFLIQFSGVANAVTASTLENTDFSKGIFKKMQNSFNQERSGDVIINLEPAWIEKGDYVTQSNSPYNYDTHVPLIWYGWKIKRSTLNRKVLINDIAPTIANFLNIAQPNACTGDVIYDITK